MEIYGIRIFVDDVERAKEFYSKKIGFKIDSIGPGFVMFNAGAAKLMIEAVSEEESKEHKNLIGRFTGISLSVGDIKSQYQNLVSQGVQFSGEPERQYWGGWLATFLDPAGNELQLVQQPAVQ